MSVEQISSPTIEDWELLAPCRIGGSGWWDALTDTACGATREDLAFAKETCAGCPLREACLDLALWHEQGKSASNRHLIWGGLDPVERAALAMENPVLCRDCAEPIDDAQIRPGRPTKRICPACRKVRAAESNRRRSRERAVGVAS